MLANFKVSVSQVATVHFVTAFVLSHLTEAHYIPAMVSDEPTHCDNHHSSEEGEEAPSPGSPTDSWQGDPSSHAQSFQGHLRKAQISGPFRTRIPQVALSIVRYLSTLRASTTWHVS